MSAWLLDGGGPVALRYLLIPFYAPLFSIREDEHSMIFHYRMGYLFGLRIFKYQLLIVEE